jgi:hypothetical protein
MLIETAIWVNLEKKLLFSDCLYKKKIYTGKILGCLINTHTYTLFRAKKITANKRYKFLGPEQCICAGIYETT